MIHKWSTTSSRVIFRILGCVATTEGVALCLKIQEILSHLGISLTMLRAQACDGASNMHRRYSGVAVQIENINHAKSSIQEHNYEEKKMKC